MVVAITVEIIIVSVKIIHGILNDIKIYDIVMDFIL